MCSGAGGRASATAVIPSLDESPDACRHCVDTDLPAPLVLGRLGGTHPLRALCPADLVDRDLAVSGDGAAVPRTPATFGQFSTAGDLDRDVDGMGSLGVGRRCLADRSSRDDNPWYLSTGGALVNDPDLPWLRRPHLEWTGSSRGDLAMESNCSDPQARTITFQTDYQGFRNSRDLSEAEIVFVGDSFTEAGNVLEEETYVWQVGDELDVVTRNLGVAGFTAPTELIVLHRFGLPCHPRVVVWQIAETNDLDDALTYAEWQQAGRPNVLPGFAKQERSRLEAWQRRSPTYLIFEAIGQREQSWPFRGDFRDRDGKQHTMLYEMSFPPDTRTHPGWQIMEFSIMTGAQLLQANRIQLVVLLIPRKLRVMAPFTDFHEFSTSTPQGRMTIKHSLPDGWDLPEEARLATHLQDLCEQLDLPFVDATDRLVEKAGEGEMVYQAMDTHLSPQGHRVITRLLVEALEDSGAP